MTTYILDVASYQGTLAPDDVVRAGFQVVNLKVSHGVGRKSVHPDITGWVAAARRLGLGISTFHFMTNEAAGDVQAEYAYDRLVALGLQDPGSAHQLDVESTPPPTLAQVRAYLTRMTELLRRPVVLYTGDWWWTARPGWNVSDLTPYVWAAPNRGYIGSYPGDTGPDWKAGYGGWVSLSVMQYAVGKLRFPDGSVGGIDVSKSAIRDGAVWRDLTLGRTGMTYAPATLKAARTFYIDKIKALGYNINPLSVGIVGDDSHANSGTSYHLGDDALKSTAYSIVESSRDRNGLTNGAAAIDYGWFSLSAGGRTHNLRTFSAWVVDQCKAGASDTKDIREVIYSTDGQTVKRWDRLGRRTTGDSSHTSHTHLSYFRDSESRDKTALLKRYFASITGGAGAGQPVEDDDMPTVKEFWDTDGIVSNPPQRGDAKDNPTVRAAFGLADTWAQVYNLRDSVAALRAQNDAMTKLIGAVLTNVVADDGDRARIEAAIAQAQTATATATAAAVRETFGGPDTSPQDVAAALLAALGPEKAAAVGAVLAR